MDLKSSERVWNTLFSVWTLMCKGERTPQENIFFELMSD